MYVSRKNWMDNNSNDNCNNYDGDNNNRKKKSVVHSGGPWLAFKNRIRFVCGKKPFLRWWSTSSSAAKITPWHESKLQFFFP